MFNLNNYADQLNPNNWKYWMSRGYPGRPENWAFLAFKGAQSVAPSATSETLQAVVSGIKICAHGLKTTICFLCSVQGVVIIMTAGLGFFLYNPEAFKKYARISLNSVGSLGSSVGYNSMILAKYSAKLGVKQAPNVWYYGVVVPFSVAKSGLYYSGVGAMNLAVQIGYYCGITEPQKPLRT